MKLRTCLLLASLLGTASMDALACYTVFDRANRVLYHGMMHPVDMRLPLREALEQRWPGVQAHMVFDQSACRPLRVAELVKPPPGAMRANMAVVPRTRRPSGPPAPLLTERRTAQAMGVPYTPLSGEVVVVPPEAAGRVMRPSVTVIPAVLSSPAYLQPGIVTAPRSRR